MDFKNFVEAKDEFMKDKELYLSVTELGVDRNTAMSIVVILAEERQKAYMQGYGNGYNEGYEACLNKQNRTS